MVETFWVCCINGASIGFMRPLLQYQRKCIFPDNMWLDNWMKYISWLPCVCDRSHQFRKRVDMHAYTPTHPYTYRLMYIQAKCTALFLSYRIWSRCWLNDCSGSAGASVVAHGVALPLYKDCFLDLRLFNSPDLRRLVLCYCCQAWTLETVLGENTALPRWWTARSIDADAKR